MELITYLLYNVTNTLFFASYAGVDLIDLVNKLLEVGNSRNMPIEKENEVREKARLAMDRVRHGPDISIDPTTDPNTVDDITTSSSAPQVKRLRPTDPTEILTSTQSPTNNPSTSNVEDLEDIGILRDAEALDVEAMINLQSLQEDSVQVEHTPNMDQHAIRTPCPPALPRLSSVRKRTPRRIPVDKICLSGLEGKLPKRTIDWQCSKILKEYFECKGDAGKCQLLISLLKSNCLVVVRRILGIKMVRSSEANNHIVINLQSSFNAIGNMSRTKDLCAARRVL